MNDVPPETLSAPSRSFQASVSGRGNGHLPAGPGIIRFACSACGEKLSVPEKYAGRKGACPSCGSINRVPGGLAATLAQPVFVELPEPQAADELAASSADVSDQPAAPHTPYADSAAAPVPTRNAGAELTERPDRWTRGPVKIEPIDEGEHRSTAAGLLRFFVEGSHEENQWVLGHRKQWQVDKPGLPMPVKVAILIACVLGLIGLVWGFFYLLLKLVIAVNG
jgi:hypothetical protein